MRAFRAIKSLGKALVQGVLEHTGSQVGFGGATPTSVPKGATSDLKDLLVALGLIADSGASPLDLDGGKVSAGDVEASGELAHTGSNVGLGGATPTAVPKSATSDLKDVLVAIGLLTDAGASPLDLDGGKLTAGDLAASGEIAHTGSSVGFGSATPTSVPASNTTDLKDLLVALGLLTDGGATPTDLDGGKLTAGDLTTSGELAHTGSTAGLGGATPTAIPKAATYDLKDALVDLGLVTDGGATPLDLDDGKASVGDLEVKEGAWFDVRAYGAVGDGTTDDTAAIQAAIDAAIDSTNAQGIVFFPAGQYKITSPITISTVSGLIIQGSGGTVASSASGTVLQWEGNDDTLHMFELPDIRECQFRNFQVRCSASGGVPTIDSIFHLTNEGGSVAPSGNYWEHVRIEGQDGGCHTGWFFDGSGAGGNANNDLNVFYKCEVRNYTEEAWHIGHTQSKSHTFYNCSFNGGSTGTYGIRSSGSYRWYGNAGGGSLSGAAFEQEQVVDNILIDGFNLEGCDRLFNHSSASSGRCAVTISNGRFATDALNVDGRVIFKNTPGPLIVSGNVFSADNPAEVRHAYGGSAPGASLVVIGNAFAGNSATDVAFSVKEGDGNSQILAYANSFESGGATGVGLIADGDATPNVQGNHLFKTQNTGATTITDFDNGHYGQEITVIIDDGNTTIDFTGTNLKGNGGADWSPSAGDHMTCVYDGTSWYCNISDNTA